MLSLLITLAHAQTAPAAPAQPNPLMSLVPFVLIFVVFYFLMIKPQKKRMEEEQKMVAALQKGDEVVTKSGIIGTISGLNDKVVTLELEKGAQIKMLRSQIGGLAKTILAEATAEKK